LHTLTVACGRQFRMSAVRGAAVPAISLQSIQPDSYLPLRVQVYRAIRDAIVGGRLRPGERIVEDRLCGELGVSRSPVREALRKLEGEGLVVILPRRGAVVTELSERDGIDLLEVREALEGLAARLAAGRITSGELEELEQICARMGKAIASGDDAALVEENTKFHHAIIAAGRNRWIGEFMAGVRAQTRRIYRSSIELPGRGPGSLREHTELVAALRQGDPEQAEAMARLHVQRALEAARAMGLAMKYDGRPGGRPEEADR
jgi:DNA-binding GntR family transcriptional regulator